MPHMDFYERTLGWALDNTMTIMAILAITIGLNFYLFTIIPKGFFPIQDEGRMQGGLRADQSISFQSMQKKFMQFVKVLDADPAVASVGGFAGGSGASNSGNLFVTLKPPAQRNYVTTDQVIARLRKPLSSIAGARLFLQAAQQVRAGGRQSFSSYQYTIQADLGRPAEPMGAQNHQCPSGRARAGRHQFRPAGQGSGSGPEARPPDRVAPGADR